MIDREQLAADLSRAHGIRIDPDDPVLVAALLNRRLLDEAISALEATVRASADRITAAAALQVDGAKETAAILVTRAGEWSAERLRIAAQEAGTDLVERISEQADRAERAGRAAMRAAWIAFLVTALVVAGAAGFWFGSFIPR
jgi:CHASE3 domain sensor protein